MSSGGHLIPFIPPAGPPRTPSRQLLKIPKRRPHSLCGAPHLLPSGPEERVQTGFTPLLGQGPHLLTRGSRAEISSPVRLNPMQDLEQRERKSVLFLLSAPWHMSPAPKGLQRHQLPNYPHLQATPSTLTPFPSSQAIPKP